MMIMMIVILIIVMMEDNDNYDDCDDDICLLRIHFTLLHLLIHYSVIVINHFNHISIRGSVIKDETNY